MNLQLRCLLPLLALLAGCAGTVEEKPTMAGKKRFSQVFEGVYALDYEADTRISSIDKTSCYTFLTGTLTNNGSHKLSRQTALEFHVYHGDTLLFRDHTHLRSDLGAGNRVQFNLLESPLHMKHCPSYDRIDVVLKKIPLN